MSAGVLTSPTNSWAHQINSTEKHQHGHKSHAHHKSSKVHVKHVEYETRHNKSHHNHKGYHKPYKRDLIVVVPRKRVYGNVHIYRHYGHSYYGYGHYHNDNDALKWLAFTAITLKLLDNLDEQAQREHEQAQVKATTAPVGESISWHTESANGEVVTTKEGTNQSGQTCREFQQTITIGGETENAFGTACLQADGSWKIVE